MDNKSPTDLKKLVEDDLLRSVNVGKIVPQTLREEIENDPHYLDQAPVIFTPIAFDTILTQVLDEIEKSNHPYHNVKHTEGVIERVKEFAKEARLSPFESQSLILGAAFHDLGHCGSIYRQLIPEAESNQFSNEEYSVFKMNEMLEGDIPSSQRLLLQGIILATSFRQSDPDKITLEQKNEIQRTYRAETKLEKLLALGDISRSLFEGGEAFIEDNFAVLQEARKEHLPESYTDFLRDSHHFLDFLEQKLKDCREFFSSRYIDHLEQRFTSLKDFVKGLDAAAAYHGGMPLESVFLELRSKRLSMLLTS